MLTFGISDREFADGEALFEDPPEDFFEETVAVALELIEGEEGESGQSVQPVGAAAIAGGEMEKEAGVGVGGAADQVSFPAAVEHTTAGDVA